MAATIKETKRAVKPAVLFRTDAPMVTFRQRFTHTEANLEYLDCGEYHLPGGSRSSRLAAPGRECLLFMWKGSPIVDLGGKQYDLANYDTLYVPLGADFCLANPSVTPASIIQCSAPAQNVHPVFHARFAEFSRREDRIRHLSGKDVYLMFDVSEGADKLVGLHVLPALHKGLAAAQPYRPGRNIHFYQRPRSYGGVRDARADDVRALAERRRLGNDSLFELPPRFFAGRPT
jgi:mannose-6-phosphate isomerase-like protein (cupin superfamily)